MKQQENYKLSLFTKKAKQNGNIYEIKCLCCNLLLNGVFTLHNTKIETRHRGFMVISLIYLCFKFNHG